MPQSFVFTRPRSPEDSYVFAGAVCREGEQQFYYDWLQKDVAPTDEARIISIDHGTAPDPIKKFEMGRTARKAWEANVFRAMQRNSSW